MEVDESGELTKTYKQSDEYTEEGKHDKPLKKKKLSTAPGAVDCDDDDKDDDDAPDVEQEKQDSPCWLPSAGNL